VDLEIESAENAVDALGTFRGQARVILSYHNYDGTPSPEVVLRRMLKIPADGYRLSPPPASRPTITVCWR